MDPTHSAKADQTLPRLLIPAGLRLSPHGPHRATRPRSGSVSGGRGLAGRRQRCASAWEGLDLVFCTGTGGVLNPNNVLRNFDAIVERAGVPRIGVHDLRHTHATLLLLDGVPLTLVSKRLGHAKVSITLDTYSHILPGFEHRAVESIGAALFG